MKTNYELMEEVVKNAQKLLQIATRKYVKNINDKDWIELYIRAEKHYKESMKSLNKFKQ